MGRARASQIMMLARMRVDIMKRVFWGTPLRKAGWGKAMVDEGLRGAS